MSSVVLSSPIYRQREMKSRGYEMMWLEVKSNANFWPKASYNTFPRGSVQKFNNNATITKVIM